jgi:hypothetical protein
MYTTGGYGRGHEGERELLIRPCSEAGETNCTGRTLYLGIKRSLRGYSTMQSGESTGVSEEHFAFIFGNEGPLTSSQESVTRFVDETYALRVAVAQSV